MTKDKFKSIVKEAMTNVAYRYVCSEKEKLSKMTALKYPELKLQNYLKSADISLRQKKILYQFRTRSFKCGDNMGDKSTKCSMCKIAPDKQQHYFECANIKTECPELQLVVYDDIFSESEEKVTNVSKVLEKVSRLLERTKDGQ